ncbi:cytochrome P450 [Candidatus Sumerlaeota bacterium]|nr:cytochrome P450 [Candidatus Sumerlaeota bacterium]
MFVGRVLSETADMGGAKVGPFEPLLIYLSAANRDPAAFPDPDEFRPGRAGPSSVSFAYGAHYCLGAPLARLEAEVMLASVAERWPRLSLAGDDPPRWHQHGPFRGLDALRVRPG